MNILQKYFPGLDEGRLTKFNDLQGIYTDWNDKINVISRKDMDAFNERHVLHSLAVARFIEFQPGADVLDFGTGGGFPGIPLAIFFPEVHFVLMDSIDKKMKVVQAVANELDLKNVSVQRGRVEEYHDQFDFITCRAVGRLSKILPWLRGKLKHEDKHAVPNGYVFLKGGDLEEELEEVKVSYRRIPISNYFSEPFFETKEIVYLSPKH